LFFSFLLLIFFFFPDTATTGIYTLSLHDALPILPILLVAAGALGLAVKPLMNAISRSHERRADNYALEMTKNPSAFISAMRRLRSEEHTSELQSRRDLVCRLLLEKKKKKRN